MVNRMVIFNTKNLAVVELLTITNLDTYNKVRRMKLEQFPALQKKYGGNEDNTALIVFDDQYIVLENLINNLKEHYKDDFNQD